MLNQLKQKFDTYLTLINRREFFHFLLCLLFSCGRHDSPEQSVEEAQLQALSTKFSVYSKSSTSVQDQDGFIQTDACDSLLFTGLYGSVVPVKDITAARDSNGSWHRRPLETYSECFPEGAKATISRDMFIGLLWYIWKNKRLDLAQDLFSYGKDHNWIMGEGDLGATLFPPGLQATLADIIYALGGENHNVYRSYPQIYSQNIGFASHLDVLHITLRGSVNGSISDKELSILNYNYLRVKQNPMFSYSWHKYSDGNQNETIQDLSNEALFPKDRLPTSADRCEPWLNQRDPGRDWQPCPDEGKTHSGGDFMFPAGLILNK